MEILRVGGEKSHLDRFRLMHTQSNDSVITFTLIAPPQSWQAHNKIARCGPRTWIYADPKKRLWTRYISGAMSVFRPPTPWSEALGLAITFYFRGDPKEFPTKRRTGDDDNLAKGIRDCLVKAAFMADDSLIVDGWYSKRYSDRAKLEIAIGPHKLWMAMFNLPKDD